MNTCPTPDQLRDVLAGMSNPALERLAGLSGVSFSTIRKIRDGLIVDPGLSKAAAMWPHLQLVAEARASAPAVG